MKKNNTLSLLIVLMILLLIMLGFKIYEDYHYEEIKKSIYPFEEYILNIDGYNYINSVVDNNKVYSLYNNINEYILKEIDTISKKEYNYNNYIDDTCKLVNDSNKIYITCKGDNKISVYTSELKLVEEKELTTINDYTINGNILVNEYNEYSHVISSKCSIKCLHVREDIVSNKINLYKEDSLKEDNVSKYGVYGNGIFTYDRDKIRIYNVNDEYKEFTLIKDITSKLVSLSSNEYILYVYENKEIKVYNLYEKNLIDRIDLYKVKDKVNYIEVNGNKLYVFTDNNVYVYDIFEIEKSNENNYVSNKIKDIKSEYGVNVSIDESDNIVHKDYDITSVSDYNDIYVALSYVEDYLLVFNKEFFNRFYDYGMSGLSIYFACDIKGGELETNQTDVVGLSFVKNNEYIIVVKLNSGDNILNVLFHETMHIIDNYLELKGFEYDWNGLNPDYFTYQNVYYPNVYYKDTLRNGVFNEEIYFIDNYARTNEKEDRARLFESIVNCESYIDYPNLDRKMKYLKNVLITYFPEIGYVRAFA